MIVTRKFDKIKFELDISNCGSIDSFKKGFVNLTALYFLYMLVNQYCITIRIN